MPRGKKGSGQPKVTKTLDERIEKLDEKIATLKAELASAKEKRNELVQSKEKAELEAIQKVIHQSGLTAEQLQQLIESK